MNTNHDEPRHCEDCGVYTFNADHICAPPPEPFTAEHPCPFCGSDTRYVADFGAPGIGQSWICESGHALARSGPNFTDRPRILTPEETR